MNSRDTDRVCSSGNDRPGCRLRSCVLTVLGAALVAAGGASVRGNGFDAFVIPQRGPQPPVRGTVLTADASVLVPSADDAVSSPQSGPSWSGTDVDASPGEPVWDSAGVGVSCLDGAEALASGAGCDACGGAGCGSCSAGAGILRGFCGDACPRWVVQIDALMLWQGNIPSRPLLSNYNSTTMIIGPTALDVNQAQPPMSAGPRVGLFYNFNQCHAIEGNYFQVRPFAGDALTGPGSFVRNNLAGYTFFGPNSPVFSSASVLTRASIQSAELNWRKRECWCPITWLAGFRWVEWDQQLNINQTATVGSVTSLLRTDTINNLYGGQFGMDLGLWTGSTFNVNGIGKAGAFLNQAAQASSYQESSGSFQSARAEADGIAFFGEVGVNGSLQLTSWLAWRLGYSLFWLSGVAVPADQLAVTNLNPATPPVAAQISTDGSVLLHGVTTGLEARW